MYGKAACGYAQPMTEAAEAPPVPGGVTNISYEQDITFGLIGDLSARLSDVLRAIPPSEDKSTSIGRAAHSPLHGRINEVVYRQESINAALRSWLDRLTV